MQEPAIPANEADRLDALCSLGILDTVAEERYDRITRIAQTLFAVPIALVSLVDLNRQWFKSHQGLAATETPRNISFCGHAILGDEVFVINDATRDVRFADNPLVTGELHLRFYAGVPLALPGGQKIGTLCIIDQRPREFSDEQRGMLRDLASWVQSELTAISLAEALQLKRDSEYRLGAIINTVADGIITIDAQGMIESFNPAAERIFGQATAQAIGKSIKTLVPDYSENEHEDVKSLGTAREMCAVGAAAVSFPIELAVTKLQLGARRLYTIIVRDITERKNAQSALQKAREQADFANKAKSEFLSSMSHELRTPLNAVLGFAQLMEFDVGLSEQQKNNLKKIRNAGAHVLDLINEVLDLARIEAGKVKLAPEWLNLRELLCECHALTHPLAVARGVQLGMTSAEGGVTIRADRVRLKQSLLNLLSNAIKYNRPHGSVDLFSTMESDHRVRIEVRDTGPGLTSEQQAMLFQPFNRLGREGGELEGTGIGLVITKHLVELMDGQLGLHSSVGNGCTFWLDLPGRRSTTPVLVGASARTSPPVTSPTVGSCGDDYCMLYVEDNPVNLELVQAVLQRCWPRLKLLSAVSAKQGLELLQAHQVDVVLMDINLPGMDGYQALHEIKSRHVTRIIPVLALTANATAADIERGLRSGFQAYFTKPLDLRKFIHHLEQIFSSAPKRARPA